MTNDKIHGGLSMNRYIHRMIRAARLEPALYEEVEADTGALGQAMGVVVLASLAAGIGGIGILFALFGGSPQGAAG
jgi:hypothetical protein